MSGDQATIWDGSWCARKRETSRAYSHGDGRPADEPQPRPGLPRGRSSVRQDDLADSEGRRQFMVLKYRLTPVECLSRDILSV